jgi:hypothetical protein
MRDALSSGEEHTMLKRSPKLKPKGFPPKASVGVVISPPAAPVKMWKGRIVAPSSFYRARRNVEYRKRKTLNDPIHCFSVRMRELNVNELIRVAEFRSAITPREFREYREFGKLVDKHWIKMAGDVIAAAALWMLDPDVIELIAKKRKK